MTYSIKEAFYTLQGEGHHAGTAAVFVRFSGCNLWSGREGDRAKGPGVCSQWCDTDFVGVDGQNGGRYAARDLATLVGRLWPGLVGRRVVLTGGEPLLQVDRSLVDALRGAGFAVHVETNGTHPLPVWVDWVTVSPKVDVIAQPYNEVKVVTNGLEDVERWRHLAPIGFLQPKWVSDPVDRRAAEAACVAYVKAHPWWRLSAQIHKHLPIDPETS